MPRDLPLGNGKLLLNFDKHYNLRDIYWPHVGQELHTGVDIVDIEEEATPPISRTGVWVDGQFAWLDAPEWEREMLYVKETLVTHVTLIHPTLQLQLVFSDAEDGELGRNPIAQGRVDGTLALHLPSVAAGATEEVYHWLIVGTSLQAVTAEDIKVRQRGPHSFLKRTRNYWFRWVNKDAQDF